MAKKIFLNNFHLNTPNCPSQQITVSTTAGTKIPRVEKHIEPTNPMIGSKSGTRAAKPTVADTITVLMVIWEMLWYFSGILLTSIFRHVMSMGT